MKARQTIALLIDPQKAFVDANGTLGKTYGPHELKPIQEAYAKVCGFFTAGDSPENAVLVTSRYRPGQFVADPSSPLYNLCVSSAGDDGELMEDLQRLNFRARFTKREPSAWSEVSVREFLEDMLNRQTCHFLVFGFLLEHCVFQTAMDIRTWLNQAAPATSVTVPLTLCGSRTSKYRGDGQGTVSWAVAALNGAGIHTPLHPPSLFSP